MNGINSKPYINLDQYIDLEGLLTIRPQVIRALALSSTGFRPGSIGSGVSLNPSKFPDINIALKESEGFTVEQNLFSTKYMTPCSYMGQILVVQENHACFNSHINSQVTRYSQHYKKFDVFHNWLWNQKIFAGIGSITVFMSEPYQSTPIHFNQPVISTGEKHQFVWIRFDHRKKFFVYDKDTDSKHYFDGHVSFFNDGDYHGTDTSELHAFSIRVDGIFSEEILDQVSDLKIYMNS